MLISSIIILVLERETCLEVKNTFKNKIIKTNILRNKLYTTIITNSRNYSMLLYIEHRLWILTI